jgi:peptidoglycan/LPS O-acetylase OafA/YrhL
MARPDAVSSCDALAVKEDSSNKPTPHWLESWHVDPSANREYDFIDGLRGLAILMVLACHAVYAKEPSATAGRYLLSFTGTLGMGVTLFFTLSGFLISWPFWRRKVNGAASLGLPAYGLRRFWKIYPPLALSVLLLTPYYILSSGGASEILHTAAQWLTGLAFFMPVSGRFNPVMWSLVVEIHFYLALPLLFLLTKPLPARTCLWLIPLTLFLVPVSIQALTGVSPTFAPQIEDPFCVGLSAFCFGVLAGGMDNLKVWNKRWGRIGDWGWPIGVLGLTGLAWVRLNPAAHFSITSYLCIWTFMLGAGCLLCYAAAPENSRARWLCAPWLRWCGIISYEWYLFHQPLIYWMRGLFGPVRGDVVEYGLVLVVPVLVSAGFSALVYRWFSLPILKFGRSKKAAKK